MALGTTRTRDWFRYFVKIGILVLIAAVFWMLANGPARTWNILVFLALLFMLCVYLAVIYRGHGRNAIVMVASLLFALIVIETTSIFAEGGTIDIRPRGMLASHPVLGWGPESPGVYHHVKYDARTWRTIFDVTYTIDENLTRKVISAAAGPPVAFFGDSISFGEGLPDAQTLPQALADVTEHSVRVLNFAYPGYGPQQFLRPLETGIFDELLGQHPRAFVYLTAPWHAERAACLAGYVLKAPRYEIAEGREPVYRGACWQQWRTVIRELAANTALARVFAERTGQRISHAEVGLYNRLLSVPGS